MAMVTLGSLLAPNMNLHGSVPKDTPCKLLIQEPGIIKPEYLNPLRETEKVADLTLKMFAERHPEWAGEYEWSFDTRGCFARWEMGPIFSSFNYLSLDVTDWLKKQSADVIMQIAKHGFAWRGEIAVNTFLKHLGRDNLFVWETTEENKRPKIEPPKPYKQVFTEDYFQDRAINVLTGMVKRGHVVVSQPEWPGNGFIVSTVKPANSSTMKHLTAFYDQWGTTMTSRKEDGGTHVSFGIKDELVNSRGDKLKELIGLKADDQEEQEEDQE